MKASLPKVYIWLINTLKRNVNGLTLKELDEEWKRSNLSEGKSLSRSTLTRHREDIEDTFGVKIDCNKKNCNRYYIANPECLKDHSIQNWMISTLTVSHLISESLSLQDQILLESVNSAEDLLSKVIEAMKKRVRLQVVYRKYGVKESRPKVVEPYCVKLFMRRWYLLVHDEKNQFFLYSMDRIQSLELTDEHYEKDEDFVPENFFREYFGVMTMKDVPMEKIVLRAYGNERYYLKDLPLHTTQKEVANNDEEDYTDYQLHLRPTVDFIREILSKGNRVKVVSPKKVAESVKKELCEALKKYEEN